MLKLAYRNNYFKFIETIGKGELVEPLEPGADVILRLELLHSTQESSSTITQNRDNSIELRIPNFIIDLRASEETLYRNISRRTRADIRKAAEQDRLNYCEIDNPSNEQLDKFSELFDAFAKEKNLPPCNMEKLLAIRDHRALVMTYVEDAGRRILCAGISILDKEHMQLYGLYGATSRLSRATREEIDLTARANKYLHWKEIQSAKRRGLNWYNFGGEVTRKGDRGVNDFKRRFGTVNRTDRRTYIPNSLLGRVCVILLYYKWKITLRLDGVA
ncbi:aminoacyltransferase [Pseudomonas stutzeri]|nr:aminoacyltransferase [Stutzerimonas stutzeri]